MSFDQYDWTIYDYFISFLFCDLLCHASKCILINDVNNDYIKYNREPKRYLLRMNSGIEFS